MRPFVTRFTILAILCWTTAAFAGPPIPGNYQSVDLGGTIHGGRYTEGWLPGGNAFAVGTTLTSQSWDGATLGTEWRYTCATELTPAVLMTDHVVGGNGNRTYLCTFSGGTMWLSGSGPWGNGDAAYPGVIDDYVEYETVMYSGGIAYAAVTNVQASAHFDNYPNACMTFNISNCARAGTTDLGNVKPAGYPDLLAAGTCEPTMTNGAWWNMNAFSLSVSGACATPARPSTWGALKVQYR